MNAKHLKSMTLAISILVLTGACKRSEPIEEIPMVNDENCKPENVLKIKNKATQEDFASKCFTRGQFKPSPKKEW